MPGFWKEPQIPTLNMWKIQMMDSVAYEKMCGRLNFYNDMVNEQWDSLIDIWLGGTIWLNKETDSLL